METKKTAEFIDGLIIKRPGENAPDFVKAKLSIKRAELITWLNGKNDEWINADLKVSKAGKLYFQVDNWKKDKEAREAAEGKLVNPYADTIQTQEQASSLYPDDDLNPEDVPF